MFKFCKSFYISMLSVVGVNGVGIDGENTAEMPKPNGWEPTHFGVAEFELDRKTPLSGREPELAFEVTVI